jgi:putative ABC transport system substrate-binding protein
MRRREFIILLSVAGASLPLAVSAQQTTTPVIGFLSSASPDKYTIRLEAFRQGLKEAGYAVDRYYCLHRRHRTRSR